MKVFVKNPKYIVLHTYDETGVLCIGEEEAKKEVSDAYQGGGPLSDMRVFIVKEELSIDFAPKFSPKDR